VIPAELRERSGLDGTRATWTHEGDKLILTPMTMERILKARGCLKSRPGEPSAFDGIFEERERKRRREDP